MQSDACTCLCNAFAYIYVCMCVFKYLHLFSACLVFFKARYKDLGVKSRLLLNIYVANIMVSCLKILHEYICVSHSSTRKIVYNNVGSNAATIDVC